MIALFLFYFIFILFSHALYTIISRVALTTAVRSWLRGLFHYKRSEPSRNLNAVVDSAEWSRLSRQYNRWLRQEFIYFEVGSRRGQTTRLDCDSYYLIYESCGLDLGLVYESSCKSTFCNF